MGERTRGLDRAVGEREAKYSLNPAALSDMWGGF